MGQWDVLTHPQSQLLCPTLPEEKTKPIPVSGIKGLSREIRHSWASGEGFPNCRVAELQQELGKGVEGWSRCAQALLTVATMEEDFCLDYNMSRAQLERRAKWRYILRLACS